MNIKSGMNGRRSRSGVEVNITPVLNLFLVLVPFLLLTTEFVKIAVLELALPSNTASEQRSEQPSKPPILIILAIDDSGYEIKAPNMKLPRIDKQDNNFQVAALGSELQRIKATYLDTEEITIQPAENILYETIVDVMDACRDNGFPNISVSG